MSIVRGGLASLIILAGSLLAAEATAQQARFNFVFEDPASNAAATGYVVFDLNQLPNPGSTGFTDLPDPTVIDLQVTITGSAQGNGTFTLADFTQFVWDTGGMALDLTPGTQVVGQPTLGGSWGPGSCGQNPKIQGGGCGDFNLFTQGSIAVVQGEDPYADRGQVGGNGPEGVDPFVLAANGGAGEAMELTSFIRGTTPPASVSVPTLSTWSWLAMAGLLLTAGVVVVRLRG